MITNSRRNNSDNEQLNSESNEATTVITNFRSLTVLVKCQKISARIMGWFTSDNFVTNNVAIPTTELRIAVGAVVTVVVIVVIYLLLRVYNKYQKKGMQNSIRREIQLNNVRTDNTGANN